MKHLKSLFIFLLLLLFAVGENSLHAQFLKNVLNSVKNTVQSRANNDASSTTNKVINKVDGTDKSKTPSTGSTSSPATDTIPKHTQTQSSTSGSGNNSNAAQQNNPYNSDGSFISLNLSSDRIIAGGAVQITGSSIKYQNFNSVAVTIAAADGSRKESRTLPLDTSGAYSTIWQLNTDDSYTVTAKSSDGKNTVSRDLGVYKPEDVDSVIEPLKTGISKASDKLMADVDQVTQMLASPDASELKKKVDGFTEKKDQLLKQLDDIDAAGKGLKTVQKKYGQLPADVLKNLSDLTNTISTQTNTMEQAMQAADHKPSGNSICEYLVMVSEACAAFATVMNFEGDLVKVLNKIAGDKVYRTTAGSVASGVTGNNEASKQAAGECATLFIEPAMETEAKKANFSFATFGGDIVHMCSDLLLKKYCAVMSGDLNQKYEVTYRNKNNDVWWNYTYTTEATINLRYPKNNADGKIIKMKGNIEGNATKFTIYQNAQEIDDYKDAMKGREGLTKFYSICLHKPIAAPFSAAKMDQAFGFGAVARAVATPACFNISIDADYDVANKKVTIYVNNALVDFTPIVSYIYGYIVIAAGIPLVRRVNYPIQPVKLTLGKVISQNHDFNVKTDADNNMSIDGAGQTQIGDESSSIEHHISFSFKLKSDE